MSLIVTTLAANVAENTHQVSVANATGITGPGRNKSTRKVMWVGREAMEVSEDPNGTIITVVRGVLGTLRVAHSAGQRVWVGAESDFEHFQKKGLGVTPGKNSLTTTLSTVADLTLTPAQIFDAGPGAVSFSVINRDPGAAHTDTLPTAAALIAHLNGYGVPYIDFSFEFEVINKSAGANTITIAAGTGGTTVGTMTIAQNNCKRFLVTITSVDSPAYTVQSLGTVVF